jgi:hypothetical protein
MKAITTIIAALALTFGAVGCATEADRASQNLSTAADAFEINRRIVFFNGITDTYLLTIEGNCSIKDEVIQLEVVCELPDGKLKKHFLGLSDNVSYFVEQQEAITASKSSYRVIFRPETLLPSIQN